MEFITERGWSIFNGDIKGDEEVEFTFIGGKGSTVIDYVIGDKEVKERMEKMRIGDKIDSDHHPLEIWIKGEVEKKRKGTGARRTRRGVWNEQGKRIFRQKMGTIELGGEELREEWRRIEGRIGETLKEMDKELGNKKKRKGWWDEECEWKKKRVRSPKGMEGERRREGGL